MARPIFPNIPWSALPDRADGPRVLGINPWITDFAAFNVWSRPAGLLACLDMLRNAGASVALLDCLDPTWEPAPELGLKWPKSGKYGTGHYHKEEIAPPAPLAFMDRRYSRYGLPRERVVEALAALDPAPDAVMVTTVMTYWYPGALDILDICAELWPDTPRFLGGTYATLCGEHAARHADAHLQQGPLEDPSNWAKFCELINFDINQPSGNAGLSLSLDLYADPAFSIILGSRGCPFACEYCASRALYPRFRQGTPEAVMETVRSEHGRGVRDFAFYDDALLVNPDRWLWPVLDEIAGAGLGIRLHTPNAMHVRHLTPEVCGRLKAAGLTTVRLGLETTDFDHRHDVKLTREQWEAGARNLLDAGFDLDDIGVYILFGLPGQDLGNVEQAVRHVRSFGFRPHLAHYTPIPGSPMFQAACEASPYPLADEPLFQNNSIWPCVPGGFNWEDARRWKMLMHGE
jgi:hypothetical protein